MKKFVSYIRVSTQKQGRSGLGLAAQLSAIKAFVGDNKVIKEFREVETGTNKRRRPVLRQALRFAKMHGATLVIAKLDRLSRNVHFISGLMENDVDFVACDNPYASRLNIHINAAVAEDEAVRISERTKVSMAELKKKGMIFGTANAHVLEAAKASGGYKVGNEVSATVRRELFEDHYSDILPIATKLRDEGLAYAAIADKLNEEGYRTRRGGEFSSSSVYAFLSRAGKLVKAGA